LQLDAGAGGLTGLRSAAPDFSLLPKDRTFRDLLLPFALPYLAYVALGGLLPGLIGPDLAQIVRFLAVGGVLLRFRRAYAFGPPLTASQILLAAAVTVAATALWVAMLRLDLSLPFWRDRLEAANATEFSLLYFVFRTLNSVLLVPFLEELFIRAYVQEAALAPAAQASGTGWPDRSPRPLDRPPLSARAVAVATALFALGHDLPSMLPAAAYFLLTTAVYARTRSFRCVVLVHALTNLALALLVHLRPDFRFLWF
jgi:membrane protease YdiL (CAAX protease family)